MRRSNNNPGGNGNGNNNDDRFGLLRFPILEHPAQQPEQAPQGIRQVLYEMADQQEVQGPINLFWDDEEEEDDDGGLDRSLDRRFRHNTNRHIILHEGDDVVPISSSRSGRRNKMAIGIVGFCLVVSIVFLGSVCGTGHCIVRSGGYSTNSDVSNSGASALAASSVENVDDDDDNDYGPPSSANIFSQPSYIPATSMPVAALTMKPTRASRPTRPSLGSRPPRPPPGNRPTRPTSATKFPASIAPTSQPLTDNATTAGGFYESSMIPLAFSNSTIIYNSTTIYNSTDASDNAVEDGVNNTAITIPNINNGTLVSNNLTILAPTVNSTTLMPTDAPSLTTNLSSTPVVVSKTGGTD